MRASHDHACCGEGIGYGAGGMHNGGRQDVGGDGIARARVDGMDDLFAAAKVEISVVARSSYGAVEELEAQGGKSREFPCVGILDADDPGLVILAKAVCAHFPADVDQEVLDTLALEPVGKYVDGISLGNSAKVELDTGQCFYHRVAV